jgi:hypothetical protein
MPSGSAAARYWPPDVAGRTYLQRIAQPLRPGDPVLFAMPQVAPDDARPPATPPVTPAAPASGPVLRRTPSRAASPALKQTPSPRSPMSPAPADAAAPPPVLSAHAPEIAVASPAPAPVVAGAQALSTRRPDDPPAAQAPLAAAPEPAPAPVSMDGPAAAPLELQSTEAVALTATVPTVSPPGRPAVPVTAAIDHPPAAREIHDAEPLPDRVPLPALRLPGAAPPADAGGPPPPRIHIGTVEVRAAPPPVPVPQAAPRAAPRAEAAPISRGYAWRFGLVQG